MKFIGRVSLFCAVGLCGAVLGICGNKAYESFFYPNRNKEVKMRSENPASEKEVTEKDFAGEDLKEILPAESRMEAVITCDTLLVIEEYDKNTDITAIHEEKLPGKYMGMDRAAFVDAMMSYELSPPLDEVKRGLVSVDVISFSSSQVLLRKSYERISRQEEQLFYLTAEDHYITVYMEDLQNVYLYTDIHLEDLPDALQEEIIQKKQIVGESNLFHFLESYSS